METTEEALAKLLGMPYEALDVRAKKVAQLVAARKLVARNVAAESDLVISFGQRAADAVTTFGGSWTFVGLFAAFMILWVGLNGYLALQRGRTFDPYPYILLNLFLSMLAAIQAPIILMSQNRQSDKDRLHAEHSYEVNLKSELEIMLLHEKLDLVYQKQRVELLESQKDQLKLLAEVIQKGALGP
jgi:uncharacterized membrane protein